MAAEKLLAEIRGKMCKVNPTFLFLSDETLQQYAVSTVVAVLLSRQAQPVDVFLLFCSGRAQGLDVSGDKLFDIFSRHVRVSWLGFLHENPTVTLPLTVAIMEQFSVAFLWLVWTATENHTVYEYLLATWELVAKELQPSLSLANW